MSRLLRWLRRNIVTGLLVWVPLGVTLLTFRFLLDLADTVLPLLPEHWQPDVLLGFHIPGFGAILALIVLLGTGILLRNLIGTTLVHWWEDLLERIPLVRTIYSGTKGFTESLVSSKAAFRQVVVIEFPSPGTWTVAFVTATDLPDFSGSHGGEPQICVYVPTTPIPTTGYNLIVPKSRVVPIDMSVDEAMRMIVTLGVVMPHPKKAPAATEPPPVS